MKLLRLKLGVPFRSLAAGFEVHFLREWDYGRLFEFQPYCLAGRNGSGKSNVLEALAAIFYHIECIYLDYRPDGFEFDEQSNRRASAPTPARLMPSSSSTSFPLSSTTSIPLRLINSAISESKTLGTPISPWSKTRVRARRYGARTYRL